MEGVNPLKESFLLGMLKVGLPTVDVYSDLALTAKLYKSTVTIPEYEICNQTFPDGCQTFLSRTEVVSHPIYATSLLIVFLINYALGWRAWYYGDVKKRYNSCGSSLGSSPSSAATPSWWPAGSSTSSGSSRRRP